MRTARPLGARVHDATIPVLPAITIAVATGAGTSSSPTRTPGGWVLGARGLDPIHGVQHRLQVRRARSAPLPVRAVHRHALVIPPLPHGGAAAPGAAASPSAGPPTPTALLLMGGCPSPRLATYRPCSIPGVGGGRGEGGRGTAAELHGMATTAYDLWAADFATEPRPLALRRWVESTVFAWAQELRGVGRAGVLYAEQPRVDALAGHLAHLQQWGSLERPCGAPYQPFVWPKISRYYGPRYASSTRPLRPELVGLATPNLINRSRAPWVCSAPWPRPYAPRQILPSSPALSSVPATAFGLGRPQASAGPTSASQAGSASTIARPRGGGSRPSWEYGQNGAIGPPGVRDRTAQGPVPTTLLGGRARAPYALPTVGHPMGGSHLALLEAALSGNHGRAWCTHHCCVHPEHMVLATTGMGIRRSGARLGV